MEAKGGNPMEGCNDKLREQMGQLAERIAENRGDHRAMLHRLEGLEQSDRQQSDMLLAQQRQGDAIEALHGELRKQAEKMDAISARVAEIEKEPGERWKKMGFEIIKYIVLAAVGAAIGFLMK